jgi:hypothetical protein
MEGVVTAVFEQQDGSRRFAVRWHTQNGKTNTRKERTFVAVNGVVVACQVVSEEGATPIGIRLWNGFEFDAEKDKLISHTKQTRRRELNAFQNEVELLTKIYDMEQLIGSEMLVDRILEFEFLRSAD